MPTPNYADNGAFVGMVQTTWDSTSLSLLDECPRKYYYRMVLGLAPAGLALDIAFGQAYHTALETFDKTPGTREARIHAALRAGLLRFHADGGYASTSTAKNPITLARTIVWYYETFIEDTFTTIEVDGKPAVELTFKFHLSTIAGHDIFMSGHLDRLASSASGDFVLDRKTTKSSFSDYYWSQFANDIQMTMYTVAGRVCFATPVVGVIVDAARIGVTFSEYMRHSAYRHSASLDEFLADMQELIASAVKYAEAETWPMRRTSCSKYGGCPYLKVCSRPASVRPLYLASDFIPHHWDPTESR